MSNHREWRKEQVTKKEKILLGYGYHYDKYAHYFKLSISINGRIYYHVIDEQAIFYGGIEEIHYMAKQGHYASMKVYLDQLEKEKLK